MRQEPKRFTASVHTVQRVKLQAMESRREELAELPSLAVFLPRALLPHSTWNRHLALVLVYSRATGVRTSGTEDEEGARRTSGSQSTHHTGSPAAKKRPIERFLLVSHSLRPSSPLLTLLSSLALLFRNRIVIYASFRLGLI